MYVRHNYVDSNKRDWAKIPDPAATKKWDGAHMFLRVEHDGSLRYFSRRPSVKGGFPERTSQLPQLTQRKLPALAGNVYSVELVHTGKSKNSIESHPRVSGLLNSLPPKSIADQQSLGPIRAVLIDTINPSLSTYKEKLIHMKGVEDAYDDPSVLFVATPKISKRDIVGLIDSTKARNEEGVIITSLTLPESLNKRIKIKHVNTYNLRVVGVIQENDKDGNPKDAMGALTVVDGSGRIVGNVGTGFSQDQRREAWLHPNLWINKGIQVKAMGLGSVGGRLRAPVYNGDSDGEIDVVD
jgi:hypothetical protein